MVYLDYKKVHDKKAKIYGSTKFIEYTTDNYIEIEEYNIPIKEEHTGKRVVIQKLRNYGMNLKIEN